MKDPKHYIIKMVTTQEFQKYSSIHLKPEISRSCLQYIFFFQISFSSLKTYSYCSKMRKKKAKFLMKNNLKRAKIGCFGIAKLTFTTNTINIYTYHIHANFSNLLYNHNDISISPIRLQVQFRLDTKALFPTSFYIHQ